VAMGFGAIMSSLSGSPVPVYVSFFMSAVIVGLYEQALRSEP
jgi:hypothetical protein